MFSKADKKAIKKNLKQYRIEHQMTLDQMAAKIGISPGNVWKIENGEVTPNDLTTWKIKRAFPGICEAA
ncbi:XRE family transcriptional regulator [bacterium]|nr:MAG: XRE family transcriptional regulator [bacterium]